MGVRPPQSGGDDDAAPGEFGIAAVDARLDDAELTFPASAQEVKAGFDGVEVPYEPGGTPVSLPEIVEESGRRQFDSRQELLNALHPVFEERRNAPGSGFLDWLRSLF